MIGVEEFEAGYDRLLAPLAEAGTELILIEPFLLPIHDVVEAGVARARIGTEKRKEWRADLDPKIEAMRELAHKYDAHLLAARETGDRLGDDLRGAAWPRSGRSPQGCVDRTLPGDSDAYPAACPA
ncbi:hypothetical protein [Amycolatopsis sp. NPDC051061]|uniref:hypothetical protein n=1 Tax=Amycolatopsis sp. NPDC051061 TaxID=3155042 RepID=UPI0034274C52